MDDVEVEAAAGEAGGAGLTGAGARIKERRLSQASVAPFCFVLSTRPLTLTHPHHIYLAA
jgi:hypothetical protein